MILQHYKSFIFSNYFTFFIFSLPFSYSDVGFHAMANNVDILSVSYLPSLMWYNVKENINCWWKKDRILTNQQELIFFVPD